SQRQQAPATSAQCAGSRGGCPRAAFVDGLWLAAEKLCQVAKPGTRFQSRPRADDEFAFTQARLQRARGTCELLPTDARESATNAWRRGGGHLLLAADDGRGRDRPRLDRRSTRSAERRRAVFTRRKRISQLLQSDGHSVSMGPDVHRG